MASKKKVPHKSPQTKKGKKSVPAKGRARTAPKKEEPFRLKVGKTYESRDGRFRARIKEYIRGQVYPYWGEWIGENNPQKTPGINCATTPSWNALGEIVGMGKRPTDLVREVRPVKARGK
jgi:hypothetical protein